MQITISITNLDELKHFERMIPFYRSFLCHNVHFSCSNSYLPIYHFIEALNILSNKSHCFTVNIIIFQQPFHKFELDLPNHSHDHDY